MATRDSDWLATASRARLAALSARSRAAARDQGGLMAIVDIVVPVQTGIEAVRRCIESVLAATGKTRATS